MQLRYVGYFRTLKYVYFSFESQESTIEKGNQIKQKCCFTIHGAMGVYDYASVTTTAKWFGENRFSWLSSVVGAGGIA